MLWYKSWLETRGRFFLMMGVIVLTSWYVTPEVLGRLLAGSKPAAAFVQNGQATLQSLSFIWIVIATLLGGAGINTLTFRGVTHGPHGSMLFTLSLPVRRRRLLGVRAALGALETASLIFVACLFLWSVSPLLRAHVGISAVLAYALVSLAWSSAFYCLSTFLSTFLDEMWQANSSFLAIVAIMFLRPPIKRVFSYDILRMLVDPTHLTVSTLPWPGILICLALSTALLFASVQVVERKQY
jgi:hypothetical protein